MSMRYSAQETASLKNFQCGVKKILLVDHDSRSRQFNLSLLQQMGYVVDLAGNSEQALAKLAAGNMYDIILLDLYFFDHTALDIIQQMTDKNKCVILTADNLSYALAVDFHELGLGVVRRPLSAAHIAELFEQSDVSLQ